MDSLHQIWSWYRFSLKTEHFLNFGGVGRVGVVARRGTIIFVILTPSLVSVLIFVENRAFLLVPLPCQMCGIRPHPSGQTGRQMLFDYSRHPSQMHPRNSPSLANAWNSSSSELVILDNSYSSRNIQDGRYRLPPPPPTLLLLSLSSSLRRRRWNS